MRRLALCAIALFAGLFVNSPALAAYRVIRWDFTGICQIYDFGLGDRPMFSDFRVLTGPLPSFASALNMEHDIWRRDRCTI